METNFNSFLDRIPIYKYEQKKIATDLSNWIVLNNTIRHSTDETYILKLLKFELENQNRSAFIKRLKNKHNILRGQREKKELNCENQKLNEL